jgi:hypothetical protein
MTHQPSEGASMEKHGRWTPEQLVTMLDKLAVFVAQQRAEAALAEHELRCPCPYHDGSRCERGAALAKEAQK